MNWFDLLLVAVILGSIVSGFARGFTRTLIGLLTFVVAVGAALWFYAPLGFWLRSYIASKPAASGTAFLVVFFAVTIAGGILECAGTKFVRKSELTNLDRGLGAGFGLFQGLFGASVLVLAFLTFSPVPVPEGAKASRYLPILTDAAHIVANAAPEEVREGYQRARRDLDQVSPQPFHSGLDQSVSF